jgi:hypothetical protein
MRKSVPLIVLAAILVAPTAYAQSQVQDQSKSGAQGYRPSAETPAQQKRETGITAKSLVCLATNQARPRSRAAKSSPANLSNYGADHGQAFGFRQKPHLLPTALHDPRCRHPGRQRGGRTGCGGEPTPCFPLMRRKGTKAPGVKGQFCGRTALLVRLSWQCQRPVGPPGIGAISGKHSADTEPLRL